MTARQLSRIQELENYVRRLQEGYFFSKTPAERSVEDLEIKEICTNVLAYCILIKQDG